AIFLAYYILSILGEQMVKAGQVSPALGMWMSSLILLPFAVFLTRQAMRDAQAFQWNGAWLRTIIFRKTALKTS
ncbi:MAG: LptF/LptG family permease, partial [Flavobacteriales bacterium]